MKPAVILTLLLSVLMATGNSTICNYEITKTRKACPGVYLGISKEACEALGPDCCFDVLIRNVVRCFDNVESNKAISIKPPLKRPNCDKGLPWLRESCPGAHAEISKNECEKLGVDCCFDNITPRAIVCFKNVQSTYYYPNIKLNDFINDLPDCVINLFLPMNPYGYMPIPDGQTLDVPIILHTQQSTIQQVFTHWTAQRIPNLSCFFTLLLFPEFFSSVDPWRHSLLDTYSVVLKTYDKFNYFDTWSTPAMPRYVYIVTGAERIYKQDFNLCTRAIFLWPITSTLAVITIKPTKPIKISLLDKWDSSCSFYGETKIDFYIVQTRQLRKTLDRNRHVEFKYIGRDTRSHSYCKLKPNSTKRALEGDKMRINMPRHPLLELLYEVLYCNISNTSALSSNDLGLEPYIFDIVNHHFPTPYITFTNDQTVKFSTCDGVSRHLLLGMFSKPFDQTSWLIIGIYAILLLPISYICLLLHFQRIQLPIIWKIFCHSVSINLLTLIDVCQELPKSWLKNKSLASKLRLISLTWLIGAILLVNGYRGLIVSDLTSPGKDHNMFKLLKYTSEFTFVVSPDVMPYLDDFTKDLNGNINLSQSLVSNFFDFDVLYDICCTAGSAIIYLDTLKYILRLVSPEVYNVIASYINSTTLRTIFFQTFACSGTNANQSSVLGDRRIGSYKQPFATFDPESRLASSAFVSYMGNIKERFQLTFNKVKSCHKTGIIDTPSQLYLFNEYAQKNELGLSLVQGEELLNRVEGFSFHGVFAEACYHRAQRASAAGFHQYHKSIISNIERTRTKWAICTECRKPKRLRLDTNVKVCFYILLLGLALSIFALAYENKELPTWCRSNRVRMYGKGNELEKFRDIFVKANEPVPAPWKDI